jgi:hypothetical protein
VAANLIGVTYKTIYNWIEDGSLKLAHPGYVHLHEAEAVKLQKQEEKLLKGKDHSLNFTRDERGRFKLLSGKMNNKIYKDLK